MMYDARRTCSMTAAICGAFAAAFAVAAGAPPNRVESAGVVRIDLDKDTARQVVVDREGGVYLGHVSTVAVNGGRSILAVYPKGHGTGPVLMKRSDDGGRTWSPRLAVPETWATSKETPTLFSMGMSDKGESLIMFSGLYPIRAARSADGGATWSELSAIGDFGGIVAMGGVMCTGAKDETGKYSAFFHDDGRFIAAKGRATGTFTLFQTDTADAGATWSSPRQIWSGSEIHLCEPGVVISPDGATAALLLRENRRLKNSHVMISRDRAATWSEPRELPACLTGDRHTAVYAKDGRLVVTFRCTRAGDAWSGDWVAWVGTWEEIARCGRSDEDGQAPRVSGASSYLVRLKDNLTAWDCGYPGLQCMEDGTLVATTYGTWAPGRGAGENGASVDAARKEQPSILCVRLRTDELDKLAKGK